MTDDAKGERERCAKVCDDISADLWAQYKGRPPHEPMNPNRANPHVQGQSDGAAMCAEAIRALAPAQAQRVEPVVAYMYQRKDGRGVTNLATIEERVPLIDLHDWCEIPLYRGPDKLPPSEPMSCAECGANLQCAYDQRHGIVDPPPRTESAASAAPWSGPPPIVSDEIADISLACTPAAGAEDAPRVPDCDLVICPNCVHQFRAIPVNVQAELSRLTAANAAQTSHDKLDDAYDMLLLELSALSKRLEAAEGALRAVIDGYDDNDTSDYRRFDAAIAAARAAMGADK